MPQRVFYNLTLVLSLMMLVGTARAQTMNEVRSNSRIAPRQREWLGASPLERVKISEATCIARGAAWVDEISKIEQRYKRGEIDDRQRVDEHTRNIAGVAGGLGAATALAPQGALWGSALGPFGMIGGGLVGGGIGYFGGEKLAEGAAGLGKDAIYSGVNLARGGATWVGETSEALWKGTMGHFGW